MSENLLTINVCTCIMTIMVLYNQSGFSQANSDKYLHVIVYCRLYHVIFTLDILHTTSVYHPSVWRISDLEYLKFISMLP